MKLILRSLTKFLYLTSVKLVPEGRVNGNLKCDCDVHVQTLSAIKYKNLIFRNVERERKRRLCVGVQTHKKDCEGHSEKEEEGGGGGKEETGTALAIKCGESPLSRARFTF